MRLRALTILALTLAGGVALAGEHEPGRARLRVEAAGPLFAATDLVPGQRTSACARVTNTGDASGRAALYAPGIHGGLAEHLTLTVTRRGGCETSDATVVYRGPLSRFPRDRHAALPDGATWRPGDAHTYRFDLLLGHDPRAEGQTVAWNWRLAVESLPGGPAPATGDATSRSAPAPPPAACRTVRGRRIVLARRHVGVVVTPKGERVELRLKGRARRVRYRLNGRLVGVATKRPFRSRPLARWLAPGQNRVAVRADGRAATFGVRVSAGCALSSPRRPSADRR
jgi:hypothetical protein